MGALHAGTRAHTKRRGFDAPHLPVEDLRHPKCSSEVLKHLRPRHPTDFIHHAHLEDVEGRGVEQSVERNLVEYESLASKLRFSTIEKLQPHVPEGATG